MSYICGMFQTSFTIRRGDSRGKQLSSSILLLGLEFSIARYIYTRLSSCKFFSLQPLCMKSHALGRRGKIFASWTLLLSDTLLFAIQLLSSVVGFEKCKWESILCYIVIATVMFLLLGFISCVFLPILNSLLDTLIEDQIIFMSSLKAKNSAELYNSYQWISGVYTIYPDDTPPFDVYCDQTKACGGWTMIQRKLNRSIDFKRT